MNRNLSIVFSIFLLVGILVPAYAQTGSDDVIINEVDINPLGDDSASISEWVELYNPTDSDIDISNWEIASTTILKKTMTIPDGTIIPPGQFLIYSYQTVWFTDSGESVELRDENGIVIDKTPILSDIQNDFTSWQRLYDGYDFDSSSDWKFVTATPGASNGKLIETQEKDGITVTVSSDKPSYLMDDTAIISGSVSEEVYIYKPFFAQATINVNISGPNYYKTLTLYPDRDLNFATTLKLQQVLGANEGIYDVSVDYAGVTANTSFSVGFELIALEEKIDGSLSLITDKSQYIPGQTVSISGFATEIIPFEGMKLSVYDSRGELISQGTLFPTNGAFTTSLFITTIDPGYGTYNIRAEYFGKPVSTTFEVIEDFKEDVPISLWTDKVAYGLGDEVKITGRVNQVWISTLDLEIIQTKQTSLVLSTSSSGFKIKDGVTIMGDGSFTYTFIIPDNQIRLGDYRINVSKNLGSATVIIHAVTDPENFVASSEPLTIESIKEVYEIGDKMIISGFIKDPFSTTSYQTAAAVKISISHEDGTPLEIVGKPQKAKTIARGGVVVAYDFVAIPETSGSYSVQIDITKTIFTEGSYVVKAQYVDNTVTKIFTVIDSLYLKKGDAIVSLDKEVYGLGETIYLTGTLPPTPDNSVKIIMTKPDGVIMNSGATVDSQRFSWSWVTPIYEKYQNIKIDDTRVKVKSNFGIYKIRVATDTYSEDLFFKVSADPINDSLSTTPLFVSTEKSLYKAGERLKVTGNVIKRVQSDQGLVVTQRVTLTVFDASFPFKKIPGFESTVYPNQGGEFSTIFELPITIFSEGQYTVKAVYGTSRDETTFGIANDFVLSSDEPLSFLLSIEKSEYFPGDTVVVHGKPSKLVIVKKINVNVIKTSDSDIDCGMLVQVNCDNRVGHGTSYLPGPDGSFTHEFVIPNSISSVGNYKVSADVGFDTTYVQFNVVEETPTLQSNIFIEKENRIPDKTISIITRVITIDGVDFDARVLSGSLITPSRGDESDVNLKVSFPPTVSPIKDFASPVTGICIIGPDANCLVRESTRKLGQIYDVVEIHGIEYNVRYSGPDVRLEKFSILPVNTEFLPDAIWNVEVIKDDQVSRFYYKITYKTPDQSRYNPLPFE